MIQIKYVGKSDVFNLKNGETLQIQEGTTISDVLDGLKVQKTIQKLVVPSVNGEHQGISYVLQANDELDLFLPLGGG